MGRFRIYQIYYNQKTFEQLDSGFTPLDNSINSRPEWYEFWAIKNFLDTHVLEDSTFYGFVSPRFLHKTHLTAEKLKALMKPHAHNIDVFLLATSWSQVAYFKNPFEQGEYWHPGILDLSQQVVDALGWDMKLNDLICSTHDFAFCNYIFAKKSYWIQWRKYADQFFNLVENQTGSFGDTLRGHTQYAARMAPMRAFIQERLPAIILKKDKYRTYSIGNATTFPIDATLFRNPGVYERAVLQTCNLLKYRYNQDGNPEHLSAYLHIRQQAQLTK